MNQLQNAISTAIHSLNFDREFLSSPYPRTLTARMEFILAKYILLLKHHFLGETVHLGDSKVKIERSWFYYESTLGIAPFQTMLVNFKQRYLPFLKNLNRPVIIDVGAHIGFFSLTAAKLLRRPRIFACEPVGITFKLLGKNVKSEKAITPIRLGFWNKTAIRQIYFTESFLAFSSLFPERFAWKRNPKREKVKVETLDTFTKRRSIERIDLLKIDAEGAEERILAGAKRTLANTRYLALECAFDELSGSTLGSLMKHLRGPKWNFQLLDVFDIRRTPEGKLATIDFFLKNLQFQE